MPKAIDLTAHQVVIINKYNAGSTFASLGKEFGCSECTMRTFLKKHVELRANPKAPKDFDKYHGQIKALHAADVSAYQMSIDLNIPLSTLARILKRLDLDISHRSKIREVPIKQHTQEIIERYLAGESSLEIAKSFDCVDSSVSRLLRENNIDMRYHYTADYNFFSKIDTQEKAYVLGYFTADGTNHSGDNVISIGSIDLEILEKMKKSMQYDGPIYKIDISDKYPNNQIIYRLSICSKQMSDDLIKLGCGFRKTFATYLPPVELVPNEFIKDYIRGLFDGDGTIYNDTRGGYTYISIAGTKELLISCEKHIREELGIDGKIYPHGNIYIIRYASTEKTKSIGSWWYSTSTIHMARKYQKWCILKE